MKVQLMLTCLCDAFFGEVGIAAVRVLEHAGCKVIFPEGQTCCGQPPFNAGDQSTSKKVAASFLKNFDLEIPIVSVSGSCVAMMRDGYPMLGIQVPPVYEISEFLIDQLQINNWPLKGSSLSSKHRVALHRSCHGRVIKINDRPRQLLNMIPGFEVCELDQPEQCCGFGGAFSINHPGVSAGIGNVKLKAIREANCDEVVSADMGCLMHLKGLADAQDLPFRFRHYIELLAEVIN